MLRLSQSLHSAVILFAVAIPFTSPNRANAQSSSAILAALEQQIDMKEFQQAPNMFKDVLEKLTSKSKADGRKVVFFVDVEAFKAENPDMPDIYETMVEFPPSWEKMKAAKVLRWSLDKISTRNATYVVLPEHILITTQAKLSPEFKLKENLRGEFKGPLAVILQQLSESLGITIVLDNRVGDKAKTEMAARFVSDTPLAGALRVFTEMADLKVLVLDEVILVTTPANAESLYREHRAKVEQFEKRKTLVDKSPPKPVVPHFGTGIPPLPPFPLEIVDLSQWLDPLWPYTPPNWWRANWNFAGAPKSQ